MFYLKFTGGWLRIGQQWIVNSEARSVVTSDHLAEN